jgi:hypothetical protein
MIRTRPLQAGDDDAIAAIFDATVMLGAALDPVPIGFDAYRHVCLGWYLGPGRTDAAVAVDDDGAVVGYALVCTDEAAAATWSRNASVRFARRVVGAGVRGGLDRPSRSFYAARGRDAVRLAWRRTAPPATVHAHLNVVRSARSGSAALALIEHIDRTSGAAGADTWYGEMNERTGRRLTALRRLGLELVHAEPNHTLTGLLGEPVQRLTVIRHVPAFS